MTMPEYDGEPLENNCCFPGSYEAASCVPCPAGTFSLVRPPAPGTPPTRLRFMY
jgi:hypothetical protein